MNSTATEVRQSLLLARRLGFRLIRRRSVALLALCVFVGSSIAAALGFFAGNVQYALDQDIAQFLGAPLVVRSSQPLAMDWQPEVPAMRSASTASFVTGATGPANYHSVALKAVSQAYPVNGSLRIAADDGEDRAVQRVPSRGVAWLDNRAMASLGAGIGEQVQIGRAYFRVGAQITFEPDRLTQLQHTLPRVMIGLDDLASIGLDQHSGRGEFRYLFDGEASALSQLEAELGSRVDADYDVLKPAAGGHPFSRMSQRANRFLGMVKVLVLVLCGSAAAVLADSVVRKFVLPSALLRCMGVERRVVAHALLMQLGGVALAAGVAGCVAGWLAQPMLASLLEPHLLLGVARFDPAAAGGAVSVGLVVIVAFVLPRLSALGSVPVVAALRENVSLSRRAFVSFASAAVCVAGLLWIYSDNAQLTLILGTGVFAVVAFATTLGWLLSKLAGQAHRLTRGSVRVALRGVGRSPARHVAPMATIALAVMAFLVTAMLRGSFLDVYQGERLEHDGNYLFTGLPSSELNRFEQQVEENQAVVSSLHPTVRARLVAINGIAIDDALVNESDTREETRSPVRLSWSQQLPGNNVLVEGTWPTPGSAGVSVDSEAMSDLGLELGDELGFRVGEKTLTAPITSRRAYRGGGSAVTFWFMFAPGALDGFEQQYLGGLQIGDNSQTTLAALSAQFPDLVITNLEQHLGRIRNIMSAITRIMNSLMLLLCLAAATVVLASALTSSDARRRQATLLRSLGVTRSVLSRMMLVEYGVLGLVAGGIGVLASHVVASLIFQYQFAMPYKPELFAYTSVPLAASVAFVALGYLFHRETSRLPPMQILQQL